MIPAPVFLTLVIAIVTTDTKEKFGLSKEVWSIMFTALAIVTGGWSLYAVVVSLKGVKSIDQVINGIQQMRQGGGQAGLTTR
jgi:hypothetical protein